MPFHPVELLLEWETLKNRPRERQECGPSLLERWAPALGPTPLDAALGAPPELAIVLTTFARPAAAERLLANLYTALERARLTERSALLVLHDACGRDYTRARRAAEGLSPEVLWLDARQRFGKPEFWRVHQTALLVARAWQPRFCLYLQDDVEFEADLLIRALELWRATERDLLRRVLYLFSSSDDERRGRWVHFERRDVGPCRLTNWFDLQAFLVDRGFFDLLDHRMVPVHPNRWKRRPATSSGVGRQFTRRLFGRAHVYQAWPPLVVHGAAPSTMNPEARLARSLDNRLDYVPSKGRSAA
jgi:hypothetical protein